MKIRMVFELWDIPEHIQGTDVLAEVEGCRSNQTKMDALGERIFAATSTWLHDREKIVVLFDTVAGTATVLEEKEWSGNRSKV